MHEQQPQSPFDSAEAEQAFEKLGSTVDELWAAQRQDAEAFEKFKQSQIAAQINSGLRVAASMPDASSEESSKKSSSDDAQQSSESKSLSPP
jgi:hypothetical protein